MTTAQHGATSYTAFVLRISACSVPNRLPRTRRAATARLATLRSPRSVLKEPARSEAMGKTGFRFREFGYEGGKELPGVEVASDPSMRKDAK